VNFEGTGETDTLKELQYLEFAKDIHVFCAKAPNATAAKIVKIANIMQNMAKCLAQIKNRLSKVNLKVRHAKSGNHGFIKTERRSA
jgi:hypothetical protein